MRNQNELLINAQPISKLEGGLRLKGLVKASTHDKPLISIITVVLNGEKFLEESIKSVMCQSYLNVEYLIIDGGSTDGTLEIIRKYEHAIDYWFSEADAGIFNAMNKSLNFVSGDWFLFLGADDTLINSEVLMKASHEMRNRSAVYYGNVLTLNSNLLYAGHFSRFKLIHQNICHQAIFYPSAVCIHRLYDERYKVSADYKYNIELWGDGAIFVYIPIIITVYNETGRSSMGEVQFELDKLDLIRIHLGFYFFVIAKITNFLFFLKQKMSSKS